GLDDLDPLLQANSQVPNTGSGIDLEPVPGREIADNAGGFIHINHASAPNDLVAEHDVLHHGQPGNQHEVLMHHPDAQLDRVLRSSNVHGAAIELDLAGIAGDHAVDDVHQGRFAGAVLTEKGVDPAPVDDEVHAIQHLALFLRGNQRPVSGVAADPEDDVSVLAEERQRLLLAPVGIVEVLRPALRLVDGQHFHARVDALGPVLEAFDVVNDGRNRLQAGDDPERVRLG